MPSRVLQPAFLSPLPLTRTAKLTRTTDTALIPNPHPRTSWIRRPFHASAETPEIHESWRVYSKPGNNCVLCAGNGATKCLYCFGEGVVRIGPETERDTVSCPHCDGAGNEICIRCDGSGIRPDTRYDVKREAVVRNLTNEEVCLLPLEDYNTTSTVGASERETERETASNGIAS